MTGAHTLAARAALGGLAAGCSLALTWRERFEKASNRSFDCGILGAFLASRLGLYLLIFFAFHIAPRGDIPVFYRPEALAVLHGEMPYRDFSSSYAPLHGFLDGLVLRLWNSPLPEQRVRLAALLYLASPVSLQFVAIDGQDNVLIALFLAASVLLAVRGRAVLSGASLALGVILVKFLPLLFAPILFMACLRRGRWLAGFAGVLALGYVPFAWMRVPLLYPLQAEGQAKTASDLPYLVEALLGLNLPGRVEDLTLVLVLVGLLGLVGLALRGAAAPTRMGVVLMAFASVTLALLLLSKKSWPPYLMLVWFPMCLLPGAAGHQRARLAAFAAFGWMAILSHSIWATLLQQAVGPDLHGLLAARDPRALVFLASQLALVGGYLWLLVTAMRQTAGGLWSRRGNPAQTGLVPRYAR